MELKLHLNHQCHYHYHPPFISIITTTKGNLLTFPALQENYFPSHQNCSISQRMMGSQLFISLLLMTIVKSLKSYWNM